MPRYSLHDGFENDWENDEEEPPHPIGFGAQWGRTWVGLEPMPASRLHTSTYSLESIGDQEYAEFTFMMKTDHSYPPLVSYIHVETASAPALLKFLPFGGLNSIAGVADKPCVLDEEDDVSILQDFLRSHAPKQVPASSSPSTVLPVFSETSRYIGERIQKEQIRFKKEHQKATKQIESIVSQVEGEAATILKTRQIEKEAAQRKRHEENSRRTKLIEDQKREEASKKQEEQEILVEKEAKTREEEKRRRHEESERAKKTDYVAKAKKLVIQLVAVRESIEPFDKNKAVSKRRLGMKKVVRGKINTLSENSIKIKEVACEVSQAITGARREDEEIKKAIERRDLGFTSDMARGKRYLIDLLASNVIQRIQAEGFNGSRGDGFPLANMICLISLENKELVPILAAHIYTVCPIAIPTLPVPASNASEEELMASLGMLSDAEGEYESFDRFLSRTENIVAMVANIMSSMPSTHLLLGGNQGAVDWLSRFLNLLPAAPTAPLPLLTAPVLHGFLSGAGHMLANSHLEEFKKLFSVIASDVLTRLDEGPIGKPSTIRLTKLVEGGLESFRSKLPSRALPDMYYGAKSPGMSSLSAVTKKSSEAFTSNPFGRSNAYPGLGPSQPQSSDSIPAANPFAQTSHALIHTSNPFGQDTSKQVASATPFGGGGKTTMSPFVSPSVPPLGNTHTVATSQFGTSTATVSSPFGSTVTASSTPALFQMAPTGTFQKRQEAPFGNVSNFGTSFTGSAGQSNSLSRQKVKMPCKFFAQGRCKFGDSCRFSHESSEGGIGGTFGNSIGFGGTGGHLPSGMGSSRNNNPFG